MAAAWSVLEAVGRGKVANTCYLTSELGGLRRRHSAICHDRSFDDDHIDAFSRRISFEQTEALVERVLPPRSIEDAETIAEFESLLDEVQVTSGSVSPGSLILLKPVSRAG